MNIRTLRKKRKEILALTQEYGVEELRVFGSVAKGLEGQGSDIDFLARFKKGTSLFRLAALIEELEKILKCKVDVVSENGLHYYIKEQILNEAIRL